MALTNCKSKSPNPKNDMSDINETIRSPLILNVPLTDTNYVKLSTELLNMKKDQKESPSYILYSVTTLASLKPVLIRKAYVSIPTIYEFSCTSSNSKLSLVIKTYNHGSTNFEDSLIFLITNKELLLTRAYYTQYGLWDQKEICPYTTLNSDTIALYDKTIDTTNCIKYFQENFIKDILFQANLHWKTGEFDSAKKYYLNYLNVMTENRVDTSIIPKYVFDRLNQHPRKKLSDN